MSAIKGRFWLGILGSETLFETGWQKFDEEDVEFAREDRVANSDLVIDVIGTKKRWTLSYLLMTQTELDIWDSIRVLGLTSTLSLIVERADDSTNTYVVKLRPFKKERKLAKDHWYWAVSGISIEEV